VSIIAHRCARALAPLSVCAPSAETDSPPPLKLGAFLARLEKQKQKDQEQLKLKIEQETRKVRDRTVTEEEYDAMVSRPNMNHETDVIQAKSVEQAISGLQSAGLADQAVIDPHPEKRLRAAYLAFEEEELPIIKQTMPGLTLKQYKDKLWKQFKKSPRNPVVAARLQQQQQQK